MSVKDNIVNYCKLNYKKIDKCDMIIGLGMFNYKCHLNSTQKYIDGKAKEVWSCVYVDSCGSPIFHFINKLKNGKFQDNTLGYQYKFIDYYLIKKIKKSEMNDMNDQLNLRKGLIMVNSNWLQRIFIDMNRYIYIMTRKIKMNRLTKQGYIDYIIIPVILVLIIFSTLIPKLFPKIEDVLKADNKQISWHGIYPDMLKSELISNIDYGTIKRLSTIRPNGKYVNLAKDKYNIYISTIMISNVEVSLSFYKDRISEIKFFDKDLSHDLHRFMTKNKKYRKHVHNHKYVVYVNTGRLKYYSYISKYHTSWENMDTYKKFNKNWKDLKKEIGQTNIPKPKLFDE